MAEACSEEVFKNFPGQHICNRWCELSELGNPSAYREESLVEGEE
jgi:hypothetical protein